jgi:hypothetical protein
MPLPSGPRGTIAAGFLALDEARKRPRSRGVSGRILELSDFYPVRRIKRRSAEVECAVDAVPRWFVLCGRLDSDTLDSEAFQGG